MGNGKRADPFIDHPFSQPRELIKKHQERQDEYTQQERGEDLLKKVLINPFYHLKHDTGGFKNLQSREDRLDNVCDPVLNWLYAKD